MPAVEGMAGSIRKGIEETTADLTERIEQLAERAERAVDLESRLRARPWLTLLVAVGAGLIAGQVVSAGAPPLRAGAPEAEPVEDRPGLVHSIAAMVIAGLLRDLARRHLV